MRRRLLVSTLTIVISTVVLFGIPLAFVLDRVVHEDAQARLVHDATRVARELQTTDTVSSRAVLADTLVKLVPSDDTVIVEYPDGQRVMAGPQQRHAITATVDGPAGSQLTLQSPADDVDHRVRNALLIVSLVAVGALAGALALALWQSRRLASPLARLASSAGRLGEGDFSLATPRSDILEIDEIAEALDRSAERIGRLLQAERSFSANAGHQLRSALTGLQLRIEELVSSEDPDVRAEADAALEQCLRLNLMIDELLALARTGRTGIVTNFDLADLARRHAEDVEPVLRRQGRAIVVNAPRPVPVVAAVGAVGQVLDILLSNAARHGAGTVVVRVSDDERHARFEVEDAGRGIAAATVDTLFERKDNSEDHHGIGLALARTLVATEGGTITLASATPPILRVEFPRA
jgi:signal transduction histidine kinase